MARHMRENTFSNFIGSGVFSTCWEASQSLQHCKFFAGYASSGCCGVLYFNPCENDCVMLIKC